MNIRKLLDNLAYFVDAPNGIERAKELILSLAYQGRLVERSWNDSDTLFESLPHSVKALKRFSEEQRLRAGNATIPIHWEWVELVRIGRSWGQKKPTQDFTYIDVSSIDSRRGCITENPAIILPGLAPSRARKVVKPGTIIYSTVRPYLRNIAIIDRSYDPEPIASTAFAVIHPHDGIDARFVFYYLRSPSFVSYVEQVQSGIAYPAISDKKFFEGIIPLPPTDEQKRIVARVDELMALCDKLDRQKHDRERRFPALSRAYHKRFIEISTVDNLKAIFDDVGSLDAADMRESIIALAVQGQLVSQNADDAHDLEPSSSILECRKRECSVPGVREDEIPYGVPGSWIWERLGNITLRSDSGWSPKCDASPRSGDSWGVLKVSAVSWGKFLPDENKALPSYLTARPEFEVKDGDFLVSRANTADLVARSVVVENPPPRLMMSDKIVRFHISGEMNKKFLNLFHSSRWARDYYASNASGTSGSMKNVSRSVMLYLPVPVPPLNEQRRIIETVQKLLGLVDELEDLQRRKAKKAGNFARSAVAAMTGAPEQEPAQMKAPKTELVTCLQADRKPDPGEKAPLATLLAENDGSLAAKALWERSGLAIDTFYQQLKMEMALGWIIEPEPAAMREVRAD